MIILCLGQNGVLLHCTRGEGVEARLLGNLVEAPVNQERIVKVEVT